MVKMKRQVTVFFLSLGATLFCAFFIAVVYSIDVQTAAVIGYTPAFVSLPETLVPAGMLDALHSGARALMPYGQLAFDLLLGLFRLVFQAV